MAFLDAGLFARIRPLLPELVKFGVVGGIGTVIDLGGAALLHSKYRMGPLESKAISVTVATAFTYLGSRFWTFKHRDNQTVRREAVLFVVLNVIGLLIAEAVIGFVTYAMGLRGQLEYNIASMLGTGLGTIFRFYAYRKWVFLDPARRAVRGGAGAPGRQAFPDYSPWERDPALLASAEAYSAWQPPTVEHIPWRPVPEPAAWQPAPDRSWGPAAPGQPWAQPPTAPTAPTARAARAARAVQDIPGVPNERVTSPLLTAPTAPTAPTVTAQERRRPVPAGPRPVGRHRRR